MQGVMLDIVVSDRCVLYCAMLKFFLRKSLLCISSYYFYIYPYYIALTTYYISLLYYIHYIQSLPSTLPTCFTFSHYIITLFITLLYTLLQIQYWKHCFFVYIPCSLYLLFVSLLFLYPFCFFLSLYIYTVCGCYIWLCLCFCFVGFFEKLNLMIWADLFCLFLWSFWSNIDDLILYILLKYVKKCL